MNKWQIICPLVAMAFAVMVAFFWKIPRGHYLATVGLSSRGASIGNELIATTNSQFLVRISPGLENRLSQFLASESRLDSVKMGDASPPVGDGKAQMCVYLRNSRGELLGIRLRQSKNSDKFEVLGYWTPRPN